MRPQSGSGFYGPAAPFRPDPPMAAYRPVPPVTPPGGRHPRVAGSPKPETQDDDRDGTIQVADYDHDVVQWEVFYRLRQLSLNHASKAWQHRYRMPLAPYALAFLFLQDDPERDRPMITAATRTWLAGPESEHPVPLLTTFTDVTREAEHGPGWDLRQQLADRCDPAMSADAAYIGLGFSTLNTTTGSFADICQSATTELAVSGALCFVSNPSGQPDDHRVFTAERRAAYDHNTVTIHSHQAFTTVPLLSPYPYARVDRGTLYEQSHHAPVLYQMWYLDQALRRADTLRRSVEPARRSHRRRPA